MLKQDDGPTPQNEAYSYEWAWADLTHVIQGFVVTLCLSNNWKWGNAYDEFPASWCYDNTKTKLCKTMSALCRIHSTTSIQPCVRAKSYDFDRATTSNLTSTRIYKWCNCCKRWYHCKFLLNLFYLALVKCILFGLGSEVYSKQMLWNVVTVDNDPSTYCGWLGDVIWHQRTNSSLVQVHVCRSFSTNSLPEPIQMHCGLEPWVLTSVKC